MPIDVHARVLANDRLSDDYCVIRLDAAEIASVAQPGQFVMVKPRPGHDPLLRRPFSIFEVLRDGAGQPVGLSLMNKRVGRGTAILFDLRAGDAVDCLGPLGRPFELVSAPVQVWMVAGGVGLAPFASLSDRLIDGGVTPRLFYGARRAEDLHCRDLFASRGIDVVCATEDGSLGDRGFVTVPLVRELERSAGAAVRLYACGPTVMMRAVAELASRFGHRCDVSLEQVMGCGLGGCYSCVVRVASAGAGTHYVRSCVNGPIFDAATLAWEELGH